MILWSAVSWSEEPYGEHSFAVVSAQGRQQIYGFRPEFMRQQYSDSAEVVVAIRQIGGTSPPSNSFIVAFGSCIVQRPSGSLTDCAEFRVTVDVGKDGYIWLGGAAGATLVSILPNTGDIIWFPAE